MVDAAIAAANPATVLADYLPPKPTGRCIVVGAGKSSAAMAHALETAWPDVDMSGVVVTRYGHSVATSRIVVREAAHPVPDVAGAEATKEIMTLAEAAGPEDLVLALISGGGSALLAAPRPPLILSDEIEVNRRLLASGLPISDMNSVRRRLSSVKGGGLARAVLPAKLVTLAISDVPGDDPAAIASGPTVPDPDPTVDLTHVVGRMGSDLPMHIREALVEPATVHEAFDPDYRLIATPQKSLEAAARAARSAGVTPVLLGDAIEGEARELGTIMAGIARSVRAHGMPAPRPCVLLSGGETTVSIGDGAPGRGGRNTEFLLSLAVALEGEAGIHAAAVDTDGIDGTEDAAGAFIDPDTLERARIAGFDPLEALAGHDSYSLLDATHDLIRTGPTLTNVNDVRAVFIA
ncbi:glycerate kinase type-2 family protein [Tranquillimonas rosea]|uniref:glycerate kinase type-2 family protein n=1 Tax=Tranquillimonas rosea TaxID=641238 RepID=UPI001F1FEA9E|nr:glycerate kinase [Tranquillimonas rosea]